MNFPDVLYNGDEVCKTNAGLTVPFKRRVLFKDGGKYSSLSSLCGRFGHLGHDAQKYGHLGYQFDVSCDSPAQRMHRNTLLGPWGTQSLLSYTTKWL